MRTRLCSSGTGKPAGTSSGASRAPRHRTQRTRARAGTRHRRCARDTVSRRFTAATSCEPRQRRHLQPSASVCDCKPRSTAGAQLRRLQGPHLWRGRTAAPASLRARFKARELAFPIPGGVKASTPSRCGSSTPVRPRPTPSWQEHPGCHARWVLDIAHRLAAGKPLKAPGTFSIPNAALNWIACENGSWQLEAWAQQAHLDQAR